MSTSPRLRMRLMIDCTVGAVAGSTYLPVLRDEVPGGVPDGAGVVELVPAALGQRAAHHVHAGLLRRALQGSTRLAVRYLLCIFFKVLCKAIIVF
uniref:SFRICE_010776 n=1 Tax=Spodoptera frugiperda TaxID=7108 RepID=A0A2H1VP47_SPOFR